MRPWIFDFDNGAGTVPRITRFLCPNMPIARRVIRAARKRPRAGSSVGYGACRGRSSQVCAMKPNLPLRQNWPEWPRPDLRTRRAPTSRTALASTSTNWPAISIPCWTGGNDNRVCVFIQEGDTATSQAKNRAWHRPWPLSFSAGLWYSGRRSCGRDALGMRVNRAKILKVAHHFRSLRQSKTNRRERIFPLAERADMADYNAQGATALPMHARASVYP